MALSGIWLSVPVIRGWRSDIIVPFCPYQAIDIGFAWWDCSKEKPTTTTPYQEVEEAVGDDCQDGGQVSKVPVGNPAGEEAVFL